MANGMTISTATLGVKSRHCLAIALLPATAYAGTSDPSGVATLILWGMLLGYGLWIAVSIAVGLVVARSFLLRALVAVGFAVAPLAYFYLSSQHYNSGLDDLKSRNDQLATTANLYLAERCGKERVQLSVRPAVGLDGVFVDVDPQQTLSLLDAPAPPVETPRMREDQKRYGQSHPGDMHKIQYEQPAHWVRQMGAGSVLAASRFAFSEQFDRLSGGRSIIAIARKAWWSGPGRLQVLPSKTEEFERRLQDMPETDSDTLSQQVTFPYSAKYVLTLRDVSTKEDRQHWVARVEMILRDDESGEIIAQYTGFAANQIPAFRPNTSYPWEQLKACPGIEQTYQKGSSFDLAGFFFREVVQYQ
jgi:hypothetical protein